MEVDYGKDRLEQVDALHRRQQQQQAQATSGLGWRCSVCLQPLHSEENRSVGAACIGPTLCCTKQPACCFVQQAGCFVQQHQNPLLHGTHSVLQQQLQELSCPSVSELLQMLPLSALVPTVVDKGMHRRTMRLTPHTAAQHWSQAVKDLQMLLYLHARNPAAACQEMSVVVHELLRWSCAVYMFNPSVLQELSDVNMETMQQQPPPGAHWQHAWQAADLSEAQRCQICAVKDFICARLEALQAERQQLQEAQAMLNAAAAAAASKQGEAGDCIADGSWDSASNRSPADEGSSSSSSAGLSEQQRWQVAQQLARVNSAGRMLIQLRSQFVVMLLQPVQAARIVCAAYPYMLLGGPLYQHLSADGADTENAAAACSACYGGSGNNADGSSGETDSNNSSGLSFQQSNRQEVDPAFLTGTAAAAAAALESKPAPQLVVQQVMRLQPQPMRVHPVWCNLPHVLVRPQLPHLMLLALAHGRVSSGRLLHPLLPGGALQARLLLCCTTHDEEDVAMVGDNFSA